MKLALAGFVLASTANIFSVVCTITDSNRIPVTTLGGPIIYEHERTIGDFNCSCDNKEIPANIKNFCKSNNYNSSSPSVVEVAMKLQEVKESAKGAHKKIKASAELTLAEFQDNVIELQNKASNNLAAIAKKLDASGREIARQVNEDVERHREKLDQSRVSAAGRAANEHLKSASERIQSTDAYKRAANAATRASQEVEARAQRLARTVNTKVGAA